LELGLVSLLVKERRLSLVGLGSRRLLAHGLGRLNLPQELEPVLSIGITRKLFLEEGLAVLGKPGAARVLGEEGVNLAGRRRVLLLVLLVSLLARHQAIAHVLHTLHKK
jgi:hypothetical protein